jgi:hypothetical protein
MDSQGTNSRSLSMEEVHITTAVDEPAPDPKPKLSLEIPRIYEEKKQRENLKLAKNKKKGIQEESPDIVSHNYHLILLTIV